MFPPSFSILGVALGLALLAPGLACATTVSVGLPTAPGASVFVGGAPESPLTGSTGVIDVGRMQGSSFIEFAPDDATPAFFQSSPAGRWGGSFTDNSVAADDFSGQTIWFRISVSFGGEPWIAFFSNGSLFPTNAGGSGDSVTVLSQTLNAIHPASVPGTYFDTAINRIIIGVPEPSVAGMSLAAAMPLARRRRRRAA